MTWQKIYLDGSEYRGCFPIKLRKRIDEFQALLSLKFLGEFFHTQYGLAPLSFKSIRDQVKQRLPIGLDDVIVQLQFAIEVINVEVRQTHAFVCGTQSRCVMILKKMMYLLQLENLEEGLKNFLMRFVRYCRQKRAIKYMEIGN